MKMTIKGSFGAKGRAPGHRLGIRIGNCRKLSSRIFTLRTAIRDTRSPITSHVVMDDSCNSNEPQSPVQMDLLTNRPATREKLPTLRRFAKRGNKKANRKKMLQYHLRYWEGVKGERKIARRGRLFEMNGNDVSVIEWTPAAYTSLLICLLDAIPRQIVELAEARSNRIAEIIAWVNRRWCDDPFSFEICCKAINVNPDDKREQLLETIQELFGSSYDHYRVLRNNVIDAEAGDKNAIDWILSESDVHYSFKDCCRALGFKHKKARDFIHLPEGSIPEPLPELDPSIIHVNAAQFDMFGLPDDDNRCPNDVDPVDDSVQKNDAVTQELCIS